MEHSDIYLLRETYNEKQILLCFNGPFSQGLIEEIGNALKRYMMSETETPASSSLDVFAVYIEITQNIRHYPAGRDYTEAEASATVVIGRDEDGHYVILAGNIVEPEDGAALCERIQALSTMDKTQLKAAYKEQLRKPREEQTVGAGLGLIDIARKASMPVTCGLRPVNDSERCFFSLRVVI